MSEPLALPPPLLLERSVVFVKGDLASLKPEIGWGPTIQLGASKIVPADISPFG
jgi:hypothetical protein